MTTKLGRIHIADEFLLKFLDFYAEGEIMEASHNPLGYTEIILKHPDMPEVPVDGVIPIVSPSYMQYTSAFGNSVSIRNKE